LSVGGLRWCSMFVDWAIIWVCVVKVGSGAAAGLGKDVLWSVLVLWLILVHLWSVPEVIMLFGLRVMMLSLLLVLPEL